jgi:aspartyl-tRNA(Asn)/glutamyl-tRNA(Gln) amidotransferase subunit C
MNIKHIAKLARLYITEEEAETYKNQLGSILEYIDKLQELNTDDVPELQHAIEVINVFRQDVVEECDADVRRRALENFSNRKEDLLQVQAVFDERTE